ncbi:two-component system, OmpR family, sensor histidine kinase VanS [Sporobacter termitidis DSM 10068]|uniref:histidine kinase n=1 Tax=Sporobacter termitidis DSM 10068 TaxID=1123282 RepID=A0A1M5ZF14_9FIRM|nr:vancomycin resistance histidine kinase VanS [Sporobacter termitidis]SHI22749.1 two-component system, OmpR family, sensor histidine kinase VanS [Sporobacter termitidis DSM 10068]
MNDNRYHQKLTRRIFTRFFLAFVIYSMALLVLFVAARYFLSGFIWHTYDVLYPALKLIDNNAVTFLFVCWLIGALVIFLHYWRKTLSYLDTIVDAAEILVGPEEEFVHLAPELIDIEEKMNRVKSGASRNARLAREAEQRKNDLIVYLAHDLKTPLTSVIGYLSLLRDEQEISEELRVKYLSVSLEKAQRLEDLINEFFEITRFNLSQLTLEAGKVNLSRMLEQLTYEFFPLFSEKNLTCSLKVPPDFEIKCDVNKMERVFDNLIRNAVSYSYPDSVINIIVEQQSDFITIWFINEGNTIPKEKLDRIFERFYRLDTSRASNTGGAGLGLAIAKEIVQLHGGTITAASHQEKVIFTVTLPLM